MENYGRPFVVAGLLSYSAETFFKGEGYVKQKNDR